MTESWRHSSHGSPGSLSLSPSVIPPISSTLLPLGQIENGFKNIHAFLKTKHPPNIKLMRVH